MSSAATLSTGSPPIRYAPVAIVLNWAIAALLLGEVALGLRMKWLHGPLRFAVFQLHKSIGITVLLLVALRLAWRLVRTPTPLGAHGWERGLAHAVHELFYLLLFALPLSGWTIVSTSRIVVPTLLYGTVPLPHLPGLAGLPAGLRDTWNAGARFVHVNLVILLYGVFAPHLAGALKHQWFDRHGDIARMAPGVRPGRVVDPRLVLIGLGALLAVGLGLWAPVGSPHPATAVAMPVAAAPILPVVAPPAPIVAAPALSTPTHGTAPAAPDLGAAPGGSAVMMWTIQSGTIRWKTTLSGDTIDGGFDRFNGSITFDPAALGKAHVAIQVDLTSVFSGDAQGDETLKSTDWFATAVAPTTIWTATRFRKIGPDRFVADGSLGLKGVTLPVTVTFTLTIAGETATMHGSATIDRTAFKIGEGEFASTSEIPAAVALDLAVTAKRH